jgi:hypothetical protein
MLLLTNMGFSSSRKRRGAKSVTVRERAILALLSERTIQGAAQKCGIDERMVRTWLIDDDDFRAAYRAAATFNVGTRRKARPEQISCAWLLFRYRLTGDQFERWQHVVGAPLERIDPTRLTGELDESFWDRLRNALIMAGATEREIDLVAAILARFVAKDVADSDRREEALELLARHLACTEMTIEIGPRVCDTTVNFPQRHWIQ